MANYLDPKEFRERWTYWIKTSDEDAWKYLCESVYKICLGVSTKFCKFNEIEKTDLAHHAFVETITKIKNGKEGKIPKLIDNSKSSPFNLLTTAISNTLYTLMAKRQRQRVNQDKYMKQLIHTRRY